MENTNEMVFDDSFFEEYVSQVKDETARKGSGGFTREYDQIAFAACKPGENRIFRFVGIPPKDQHHTRRNWDPKDVVMSEVKSDDNKRFTLRLPPREKEAGKNHIVHRLYDRINEIQWINKQKVVVNQAKYPDLIERSTKMGFTPEDGDISYKSANGLKGSKFIIQNVIDRHDNWCKENKHTKVLANSVNTDKEGRIWGKAGIKEFGYIDKLVDIISKYKLPENYDIAIKRIAGAKTSPWELRNASLYAEKDLMDELKNDDNTMPSKDIIVIGPLTAEEQAYEKYDLDKLYGPTTYQTILKRIPSIFKECDAALRTKFYDELVSLAEEEKKHFDEIYKKNEAETTANEIEKTESIVAETATSTETPAPKRRATVGPVETGLSAEKISALKGWGLLKDEEKSLIKDVIFNVDGSVKNIEWVECDETSELLACDCGIASPSSFESCPNCASKFV